MKFIFIFIPFLIPSFLTAHPHVFIDNSILVIFNETGLAGFKHEWIFDEMFSSTIIHEFDLDSNGKFDEKEIKEVKRGAFSNLEKHDYFTDITINGRQFEIKEVEDFHARIDSGVMVYNFFLPCEVNADSGKKEVKIAVYDQTYFVQVMWESQEPFNFKDTSNFEIGFEVIEDEKKAYYYGQIIPEALKIKFSKRP